MGNKSELETSFVDATKSLGAAVKAAYNLAPLAVVIGGFLFSILMYVAFAFPALKIGLVSLLVLFISLVAFSTIANFGESSLALMAGLFAALTVNWNDNHNFLIFCSFTAGFLFLALLISSVKLAGNVEKIYTEAAIASGKTEPKEIHAEAKELRELAKSARSNFLGPVERAQCVRLLSFRKIPKTQIKGLVALTGTISAATSLKPEEVGEFIADCFYCVTASPKSLEPELLLQLFDIMRSASCASKDFIAAFHATKDLLFEGSMTPRAYLEGLAVGLKHMKSGEILRQFLLSGR